MFKRIIQRIIRNQQYTRIVKALIRNSLIHEKSEKYRRDVKNAILAYEFEQNELRGVEAFENWEELLDASVRRVNKDLGAWVELGVMTGNSTRAIAATAKKFKFNPTLHGFDSFNGLPEDWHARSKKGAFAIKQPTFTESNIIIHVGLFSKSLPEFVKDHPEQIGFLHVDSDLYSSAKCGFDNLNIGKGTVILFDEYWNYPEFREHEMKAFGEFIETTGFSFDYIGYNKSHMQLSVVIV